MANNDELASAKMGKLEAAAKSGDAEAQYQLAERLRCGNGLDRDLGAALKWMKLAAAGGHAHAQEIIRGLDPDHIAAESLKAFTTKAEAGDADAQYELGILHYGGSRGLPQSLETAVHWFRKAAAQGHAGAQFYLGQCYEFAEGVAYDGKAAARWYRLAADRGGGGSSTPA